MDDRSARHAGLDARNSLDTSGEEMTFDEQFRDLVREAVQQSAREHLSVQYIELSRQIRARVDEALAPIVARREYDANHPFRALVEIAREIKHDLKSGEELAARLKTQTLVTLILMGEDE
jgi:hypothetical protein